MATDTRTDRTDRTDKSGNQPTPTQQPAPTPTTKPDNGGDESTSQPQEDPNNPVDPVTNQPISDFFPGSLSEDHKDAIAVQNRAMKGATGSARVGLAQNLVATREEAALAKEQADENVKSVEDETKKMFDTMTNVPPDLYYAREKARVDAEAAANTSSTTVPGGAFKQGDQWVNAEGEPVEAPEDAE